MTYILETNRLRLREFTLNDTDFIIALLNSPGWLQYIGDRNVKTQEQAISYLENGPLTSYRQHGFGLWLVESKADEKAIGMCGILKRDTLEHPDLGFAFLPSDQRKGYGYEIASKILLYANHQLKLFPLSAISLAHNVKSIRLLEKLGFRLVRKIRFSPDQEDLLLYYQTESAVE
jgi:RimJ/RimL family protein N-acetyltransferase